MITFRSACETSADFTSTSGTGLTFASTNNGYSGNSLRIAYSGSFNTQTASKILPTASDVVQIRFKIATAATMNGTDDAVILALFDNTSFGTSVGQIRAIGSGAGFVLRIVDPSNSFSGDYSSGLVVTKGDYHTLAVKRSSTGITAYLDMSPTPILTYTFTQTGSTFPALTIGNAASASGALVGDVDFDDVFTKNSNTVTTEADRIADAIEGFIQRYHSHGAIIRPIDPAGAQTSPDSVSEAVAYALKLYAQGNLQTYFDEAFTWAYNNMRRGSTPGMSPTVNTPTNAFNLYSFKYNAVTKVVADANWAGDADHEIAQALLWAHARWGSGGTVNYLARALEILADIRTFAIRPSTVTGFQHLMNDSFQSSGGTVQIGGDYDNPPAYRLFAKYDSANASTWLSLAQGAYDLYTKQANYTFTPQLSTSGLNPNWSQYSLTTDMVTGTSTYGDSDWGYNSFRMMSRMYDDFRWYGTAAAVTALRLPKTFITNQYNTVRTGSPLVYAEYLHDGTTKGAYEAPLFYYPYYYSVYVQDNANTVATGIATNKFPTYSTNPAGGYFGSPGYFGDSWLPVYRMQVNNTYTNYGQNSSANLLLLGVG